MSVRTPRAIPARTALALALAVVAAACGSREPSTDAERLARGRELVEQMSARLASATELSVTTAETRDVVRPSGSKESVSGAGVYTVRRPDRFYARTTGARALESWYDGRDVTIVSHAEKVFAQAPMPETINRALDALAERYDMALPMGDLFYAPAAKALLAESTTGGYVGTEEVAGTPCAHLAFQDTGVDYELWIPVEGDPLPKRYKVTQKARTGQPVIDVTFTAWTLTPGLADGAFAPKVPADYEGIAVLQRAAAVKHSATATPPAVIPDK